MLKLIKKLKTKKSANHINEKKACICAWYKSQLIYQGDMGEYPFREELILEKSKEWFDDEEPCFIHRSAVTHRLTITVEDYLKRHKNKKIAFETLPSEIQHILSGSLEVDYITLNI